MKHNKLMMMTRAATTATLLLAAGWAQAQVAVIVNPKNATATMTADQVSGIFLGKSNTLPSGATAAAVDQPESAAVREQFYTKVTGKQAAQVKAAWSRLVFSGKGTPPKELASSAEIKKFVAATPDAIAYIEKSAVDASVKVVLSVD